MRCIAIVACLLAVALAGCTTSTDAPAPSPPDAVADPALQAEAQRLATHVANGTLVAIHTSMGNITVILFDELMPTTTARFLELVEDGFHDDTFFHRVIDDFVIQAGDPSGTGWLGSGQTIPFERHERLQFGMGALGMARDVEPDSADSQWFLTDRPAHHLHNPQGVTGDVFGAYAMFGQALDLESQQTIHRIAQVTTLPGADRPIEEVTIHTIRVHNESVPAFLDRHNFGALEALQASVPIPGIGTSQGDLQHPAFPEASKAQRWTLYTDDARSTSPPPMEATHTSGATINLTWSLQTFEAGHVSHAYPTFPIPGEWTLGAQSVDYKVNVIAPNA